MKTLYTILMIVCIATISYGQQWHWERNDDLLNPYHIYTTGTNCPFTGDFDRDGDTDLIVGCRGGVLQYYENIGTVDSAIWQMDEGYFSSLSLDTSYAPQPSLVDLDGDGVEELYLTFGDNNFAFAGNMFDKYANTGTQDNPVWVEAEFTIEVPNDYFMGHQFADYDYDGDNDLLLSGDRWLGQNWFYFENVGDSTEPAFQLNDDIFADLNYEVIGEYSSCNFVDILGDNKYELFISVGEFDVDCVTIHLFENFGTAGNPDWRERDFWYASNYVAAMSFADMDNDSDKDLILGNFQVPLLYNENIGTPDSLALSYSYNGSQLGPFYIDGGENICLVDYDQDDDFDLNYMYYWRTIWEGNYNWGSAINIGSSNQPQFDLGHGFVGGEPVYFWNNIYLSEGDLNGDGYPELATHLPAYRYLINQGGNGYSRGDTGSFDLGGDYYYYPELADYNSDGLPDLLVRKQNSRDWMFYRNSGTAEEPAWTPAPEWLTGLGFPLNKIRGANINRDERIDLIAVNLAWNLCGFINTGEEGEAEFVFNPSIFDAWQSYHPAYFDCADIDGDGDDDILYNDAEVIEIVENESTVDISENESRLSQDISLLQNYPNPFNSSTNISFTLDKRCEIELAVYDILGRKIESLIAETLTAGKHTLKWTANRPIPSGIYFYRLKTSESTISRRMVYVK